MVQGAKKSKKVGFRTTTAIASPYIADPVKVVSKRLEIVGPNDDPMNAPLKSNKYDDLTRFEKSCDPEYFRGGELHEGSPKQTADPKNTP